MNKLEKLARVTDKHCGNKRYNVCVRVKAVKMVLRVDISPVHYYLIAVLACIVFD